MTKAKFYALAEANGIQVEYTPGGFDRWNGNIVPFHIMLDAPKGKLFKSSDCHCDGSIQANEGKTRIDWRRACEELQVIINNGFEDCTDPECEYCHEEDEE